MSSFIMSDRIHATLANALEYILNSGFNRFGFDPPTSLHKALEDCRDKYGYYNAKKIYNRLFMLNNTAYAARYKNTQEVLVPDMPEVPPLIQERQRIDQHEKLLPWHYKFCAALDCLIYQSDEDATRNDPLLLALIDFSHVYKSFLVSNTKEYHAALLACI